MTRKIVLLYIILSLLAAIRCEAAQAKEGVRGVWVPAPQYTSVLHSYSNIKEFVSLLDNLNMNSIFLVSYAGTQTIYKSMVLTRNSTYTSPEQGYMLAEYMKTYQSPTNDPVRDLMNEAHQRGIKVFFWFEYGFMGEGRPIPADNPLLAKNPSWLGMGNNKTPANYNEHDYYFNAYNPEVQDFIIDLVEEAITLYPDLDGVQGDDRLPAMPRNSGYDDYTVALYQKEHQGVNPPVDFQEPLWVRWRLDILNDFAKTFHKRIKSRKPELLLSFAPNPYPWCEEKLMQEWPQWCKEGICDLLAVQCYRYSADAYRSTIQEILKHIEQSNPGQLFAPGMILMEGGNSKMTPELLMEQLQINRNLGINSEIFFYNKALENPTLQELLLKVYQEKLLFPKVNNLERQ